MSRLFFASPPFTVAGDTVVDQPQAYSNNDESRSRFPSSSSSSSSTSIIIVVIVIASAILISASLYLLIRFASHRFHRSFRTFSADDNVVSAGNLKSPPDDDLLHSLPLFTFGSVTKKAEAGDCAVCLSKFELHDQLRLLPLCCHAFHADCIDTWLASNQTCPLCRSTVNPTDDEVQRKILPPSAAGEENRSNSFRIEIGSVSRRQLHPDSGEGRRSYSIGSFDYIVDDGYEVYMESTHHRGISDCTSVDKDSTGVPVTHPVRPEESLAAEVTGNQSWLRDYVDQFSSHSFRSSGRFFTGSSRRSDAVVPEDIEGKDVGEEISELFRWLSGV